MFSNLKKLLAQRKSLEDKSKETKSELCKSTLIFSESQNLDMINCKEELNNEAVVFFCQRKAGHRGKHEETGSGFNIEPLSWPPFKITWDDKYEESD
jgi:hypothetical protein